MKKKVQYYGKERRNAKRIRIKKTEKKERMSLNYKYFKRIGNNKIRD